MTSISDITRPKLMPLRTWATVPNAEEAEIIPALEEGYIQARALFERYDIRAKGLYGDSAEPIAPGVYIKWLRTATYQYTKRNAEADVNLRSSMIVQEAHLAGLGYISKRPFHGEVPLTVAPHHERVGGALRGFVADGDRIHMHHVPAKSSAAPDVNCRDATSVGIGDTVHQALHYYRDGRRQDESRFQQVEGDFDFILPHMQARGYAAREVKIAREKAHDLNNDLGIYRGGK